MTNPNNSYRTKEGTDKNGHRYTRTVRAEDQKAAALSATNAAGFIRPIAPQTAGTGAPSIATDKNGTTSHRNAAGQLHRTGGLPAVEHANGQVEHWEDGECVSRSMPGLIHPNHVTCAMAQIYVKQSNGSRKEMVVKSSTSGASLSLPGEPAQFDYRGVPLTSQESLDNAMEYPADEFDAKYGDFREELVPLADRFDAIIAEGYDEPAEPIHVPRVTGAGLNDDGRNKYGYDISGYDEEGYDSGGYGRDGLHKITGFDRAGYGADSYNALGINRQGLNRKGEQVAAPVREPVRPQQTYVGATDGVERVRKRDASKPPAGAPAGWMPPEQQP